MKKFWKAHYLLFYGITILLFYLSHSCYGKKEKQQHNENQKIPSIQSRLTLRPLPLCKLPTILLYFLAHVAK